MREELGHRISADQALKCPLALSISLSSNVNGANGSLNMTEKHGIQYTSPDRHRHTYIDAPTHSHSHSHKHMRMRHISPQLLYWIHPNMVGDISMATAGRRGAGLYWMISRESLLFDFWFKLFSFNSFIGIPISSGCHGNATTLLEL